MKHQTVDCIDAGTENCPCYLAQTGDCLICSRLAGQETCDCKWQGVCVYNEFRQSGGRIANPRKEFSAPIAEKKYYLDDLAVFILEVGRGFAEKCSCPGSYVFLRRQSGQGQAFYDAPISVMRADAARGQIHLAVKQISAKTKALFQEDQALLVRGVYRNGIQRVSAVDPRRLNGASVLLLAKGVGFAPAVLIADAIGSRNRVDLIVDTEKISRELVEDYADHLHSVQFLTLSEAIETEMLRELMERERYDSIAVLASDYFGETICKLARETLPEAETAASNNFRICCGEGVCGACSAMDAGGEIFKMCKCQREDFAFQG